MTRYLSHMDDLCGCFQLMKPFVKCSVFPGSTRFSVLWRTGSRLWKTFIVEPQPITRIASGCAESNLAGGRPGLHGEFFG